MGYKSHIMLKKNVTSISALYQVYSKSNNHWLSDWFTYSIQYYLTVVISYVVFLHFMWFISVSWTFHTNIPCKFVYTMNTYTRVGTHAHHFHTLLIFATFFNLTTLLLRILAIVLELTRVPFLPAVASRGNFPLPYFFFLPTALSVWWLITKRIRFHISSIKQVCKSLWSIHYILHNLTKIGPLFRTRRFETLTLARLFITFYFGPRVFFSVFIFYFCD